MAVVELAAGPVTYEDTGGTGPVVLLGHGPPMDSRAWRKVVPLLPGFRVITPTLPLGGHRTPMRPDADLSQRGIARLLGDLLDALDLTDVTLVLNDWGGGQFLINDGRTDRVGRLVLAACEAFDNFPPGAAKSLGAAARVPGGMWLLLQLFRLRAFRRMPGGYGGMSVAGLPDDLLVDWFAPATRDRRIRRDFARFAAGAPGRSELLRLAAGWRAFTKPVLVVWAEQDPLMPAAHGPRLAALYPDARLEVLADCATLVGEDQPERFARLVADFAVQGGLADSLRPIH
ncbi:alpha/beta fold hydrolase [Krasilnikoviella flava]|uniref:Pimeloyl-ACP methyl ester carboxylesterase n=1 Tax=Krasilnikoviella flava TaxID=526729 RepID=A0A1T5KAX4_9MICO|nr:alpha/beta hydrolase [Krasilnikoviella flava]SKC60794.1 Pimeloyl-ACP methyl ester carboxylesterase [Krasilnikoviella flava]